MTSKIHHTIDNDETTTESARVSDKKAFRLNNKKKKSLAIMSTPFSSMRFLFPLLVVLSVLAFLGQAFVIPGTTTSHCSIQQQQQQKGTSDFVSPFHLPPIRESVSLFAKKKRRRRKKSGESSPPPSTNIESEIVEAAAPEPAAAAGPQDSNELPDFDLGDDDEEAPSKQVLRVQNTDPDEITPNMMGSGSRGPSRSLDELINDRSLESRFEFEEKGDPSIPDFVDLAASSSSTPTYSPDSLSTAGIGKKKQRQAERVARAIAAKEAAEPEESQLANLFPMFQDEKGDFSALKVLEGGAWVGIFLLVVWEIYINSPFFERAAPMAPVVFEMVMQKL